jgi:hypothetical protein
MNDRFIGTGTANESGEFCIPAMAVGVAATLGGYRSARAGNGGAFRYMRLL